MTSHELKLLDMGARLYARQVMGRAALREERAQQERLREERARVFWQGAGGHPDNVLSWPEEGAQ